MRRGIIFLFASLLVAGAHVAMAEDDQPRTDRPLRLQKYVRLQVTQGRIEVMGRDIGQSRTLTSGGADSAFRQQLQLQVKPPGLVVEYEAVDPDGRLTLRHCERRQLVIERTTSGPGGAPDIRYEQPAIGAVMLMLDGSDANSISAPSLWHLLLCHRDECREHLLPLLESLSPSWKLDLQAEAIEAALLAAAPQADVRRDELTWEKLVADLASGSFQTRQAADAALRDAGPAAAAFLTRLPQQSLSAEQRLRIDGICRSFSSGHRDEPGRVANELLGDRSLWLSLLTREDAATRTAVADHLSRLVGRRIAFDPAADEKTRQLQVAELQRRLGGKK